MGTFRAVLIRGAVPLLLFAGACSVDGRPAPVEIDVSTLDVGSYPTEPLDVDGTSVPTDGPILEGIRMAQVIAIPYDLSLIHI